jgi:hypothetical protein
MTKQERATIKKAVERLEALCDTENDNCCVAPEHKKAVRIYLNSWVIPGLRVVATPAHKRTRDDYYAMEGPNRRKY